MPKFDVKAQGMSDSAEKTASPQPHGSGLFHFWMRDIVCAFDNYFVTGENT